ncbi:MAG: alpha/beta hydrolase [Planctomycetota bacterium]
MIRSRIAASLVAVLAAVSLAQESRRPQTPELPLPYPTEEITFASEDEGVTLAGTMSLPDAGEHGPGPYPAVVLVTGSGPQDRDQTVEYGDPPYHKTFAVIADHLARHGIATLRYDDRSMGASILEDPAAGKAQTTRAFSLDAAAALTTAKAHTKIDAERVGMLGHSEGGLIAAMLMKRGDLDGPAVLLAANVIQGTRVIVGQFPAAWEAQGMPENRLRRTTEHMELVVDAAKVGDIGNVRKNLFAIARIQAGMALVETIEERIAPQIEYFTSQWMRGFLNYDPELDLVWAKAPVLAMFGGRDLQILEEDNVPIAEEILPRWPEGSEVVVIPEANHLFQEAETGSSIEYVLLDQTIMPEVLNKISMWLRAQYGLDSN